MSHQRSTKDHGRDGQCHCRVNVEPHIRLIVGSLPADFGELTVGKTDRDRADVVEDEGKNNLGKL